MKRRYTLSATPTSPPPNPQYSPRIVAFGGGHGLHTLLRGLKIYTQNLTAVVTVSDDGGSSGFLRKELSMPAPGDIRNCMQALSNAEPILQKLLEYRFADGSLQGQSFGNLLLAALNGIAASFDEAVAMMQQVLSITGQVLPVTLAQVQLKALFENGCTALGESSIAKAKLAQNSPIRSISLQPDNPQPLPAVLTAIAEADLILMGPGSLYTSLIPHLLVSGIAQAIRQTKVPRIYIANLMTEAGETDGYSLSDHLHALTQHGGQGLFTACLYNNAPIPPPLLHQAIPRGLTPIFSESWDESEIKLFQRPLVDVCADHIRHQPILLAQAIQEFYESRAIKVFPSHQTPRFILEGE